MNQYTTIFYKKADGEEPAKDFLLSLDYKMRAKMLRMLEMLQLNGSALRLKKGADMTTLDDFLKEQLEDPKLKEEYDALAPEFAVMQALIDARKNTGMTQKELSAATGISQADISRLEHGNGNPSLRTLQRIARALKMSLKIEFVPTEGSGVKSLV